MLGHERILTVHVPCSCILVTQSTVVQNQVLLSLFAVRVKVSACPSEPCRVVPMLGK